MPSTKDKAKTKAAPEVDVESEAAAARKALEPAEKRLRKALGDFNPENLAPGAAADLLYQMKQASSTLNAMADGLIDTLTTARKALEEHFINTLVVSDATGVQGHAARVQVTDSPEPTVENWDEFYRHISRTKSFELLNRAVNRAAVKERWDQKKRVPGVGVFHIKKVSCTKLSGKAAAR